MAFILENQITDTNTPNTVNCTVRKYLTEREVETLMDCARKRSRYGHRDATMILVAYRHGLRASELCDLQWHQIELDQGRMHVHRAKNGTPSVHPIRGDEIRALRRLRRENPTDVYVFVTERGGPHDHHRVSSPYQTAWEDCWTAVCSPSTHASPCLRLQACQRRTRYPRAAALPRPQEYRTHGEIHRNVTR
jgi:site-specific recombinase XerC